MKSCAATLLQWSTSWLVQIIYLLTLKCVTKRMLTYWEATTAAVHNKLICVFCTKTMSWKHLTFGFSKLIVIIIQIHLRVKRKTERLQALLLRKSTKLETHCNSEKLPVQAFLCSFCLLVLKLVHKLNILSLLCIERLPPCHTDAPFRRPMLHTISFLRGILTN